MGRFLDVARRYTNGPKERACGIPNVDILAKNEADAIENGPKSRLNHAIVEARI